MIPATVHMGYEVRVLRAAQWRVEGVFDDEVLAIAAAKKAEGRHADAVVAVIQEIHDAARNKITSRSIYRTAKAMAKSDPAPVKAMSTIPPGAPLTSSPPPRRLPRGVWLGLALLLTALALLAMVGGGG